MAKMHPALPAAIKQLTEKEKEKIILRFARSQAEMRDILAYELLEEVTLESLEEEARDTLHSLLYNLTGRSVYKGLSKAVTKGLQEIARVKKITKEPQLEVDLLRYMLQELFGNYSGQFGSSNHRFANKMARLTLRLHSLISKNLHPDLHIDYKEELDGWLQTLRERAPNLPVVQSLPEEL